MKKYFLPFIIILPAIMFLVSCEDFFDPEQQLDITESKLYDDWYEYRSIEMGLYGLQQKLVEQLLILGELRGDLLTITENADADMVEVYNFNISKENKYASPTNFFKLIAACNNFIRVLETRHPEVTDPDSAVTNYDRLYGEALCMRAWTYFNAARIYGKVPYIHESLVTIEEIGNYINSPGEYIDSVYINYATNGYYNDTVYNYPVTLEKNYYDLDLVIDVFTSQLENNIKAVGVIHYIENNDETWEVTIWNNWALYALLGQMYLTKGDLARAAKYFGYIIYNSTGNRRYQLDNSFAYTFWPNIFTGIDNREHIYTIWFDKANFQQNQLQMFFEPFVPNKYMLKPTKIAIDKWETIWRGQVIDEDLSHPEASEMLYAGFPSDYFRGIGISSESAITGASYLYVKGNRFIDINEYAGMIILRAEGDDRASRSIMDGFDTIVYKYSIGKDRYSHDANFIIYRAGSIHLYMAEIYTWRMYDINGIIRTNTTKALNIMNDGRDYSVDPNRPQQGVLGRVGLIQTADDGIRLSDIIYTHDPYTNEIIGFLNYINNLPAKQRWLEERILDERARELAFEGERFYDLMRVAKRRNDPSFLAKIVSAKYPESKREQIYNYLLDENNWYIRYFDQ
ncbi:MAG: RagB/SusD family nutrient uptake outer membrane protein [Bacteroidales bacterium]|nr:RagB/SusD family nutrient uptake outer membrane protein [Bacteroidales bacterium]